MSRVHGANVVSFMCAAVHDRAVGLVGARIVAMRVASIFCCFDRMSLHGKLAGRLHHMGKLSRCIT